MLDRMTPRQQVFALVMSVVLLVFIVEMVRRRRLREEYSWLWILVAVAILVLSAWFGLLLWLTNLIGAVTPVSTFFVFGILFLVVVNIYFSIKVSTLTTQVKNLAQRLAIMDQYLHELRAGHEQAHPAALASPPDNPATSAGRSPAESAGRTASAGRGSRPERGCSSDSGGAEPHTAAGGPEAGTVGTGETGD